MRILELLELFELSMQNNNPAPKPFLAKGSNIKRCATCKMASDYCICEYRNVIQLDPKSPMEICLLMHKEEGFKPTNTGRLIEDCLPETTRRYYWHRTSPDPDFLALLKNQAYQGYIIFPADRGGYDERTVQKADTTDGKIPVFIILDGSWRQAGRMFRLSEYLQHLPVLPLNTQRHSQYKLRKAPDEFHLCTVEVAMEVLSKHGQEKAVAHLQTYFEVFNDMYDQSRRLGPKASVNNK